jgi:diguanylate cyclase (GGDEF)-like protein/PAS domain S-box-containing protein
MPTVADAERARLELALLGTRLGLWDWNMQTGDTVFNDRWAEIVGYALADLGRTSIDDWVRLSHPNDLARSNESIERHVEGLTPFYDITVRMLHRDGHWVWVHDRGTLVERSEDGRPLRMVGTHEDVTAQVVAEQELAASERRLVAMFQMHDAVMLLVDPVSGEIVDANRSAAAFYGYPVETLRTMRITQINMLSDGEVARRRAQAVEGVLGRFVFPHRLANGSIRTVEVHSSPIEDHGRTLLFSIIRDVTEREVYEGRLRQAATFFSNALEGVVMVSADRLIQEVNPAFTSITGWAPEDVIGRSLDILRVPGSEGEDGVDAQASIRAGEGFRLQRTIRRADGKESPILLSVNPIVGPMGETTGFVAQVSDIGERVRAEQARLDHMMYVDQLTGLPNRLQFTDLADAEIRAIRHTHAIDALVLVNLDRFKDINEGYGHDAGDAVMSVIAERFAGRLRAADILARYSGDEFAILLRGLSGRADADGVVHSLLRSLQGVCALPEGDIFVTACIGVVMLPEAVHDAQQALQRAMAALHTAKDRGPGSIQHHVDYFVVESRDRLMRATQLRQAWQHGELRLAYQPQLDLRTGQISGVEALMRWRSPVHGDVPPSDFIPVAEDIGLIADIGIWALQEACRQGVRWAAQGLPALTVSVNVSAQQLVPGRLVDEVVEALRTSGLPSERLVLELTESALLHTGADTMELLTALADIGVRLAIDDFGTGYSSFAYLRQYPLSTLKIDRSFVQDLEVDASSRSITTAIIAMGHGLGIRVVAEGVETTGQRDFLLGAGCDLMQGFLLSPAIDPATLTQLMGKLRR